MRGLVLTGGGARGADQIGRVLALHESGRKWDMISGTSVGAINATGIVTIGVTETVQLWLGIKGRRDLMRFNWSWPWNFDGWYSFDPLKKYLKKFITREVTGKAWACTVDCETLKVLYKGAHELPADEYIDWLIASCVVVGIQSPVFGRYVDGGHREFAPIKKLIEEGATEIDVVSTSPFLEVLVETKRPKQWFPILWHVGRGLEALTHEVWMRDIETARAQGVKINIYAPDEYLDLDPLDYDPKKIFSAYNKAYQATKELLK